MAILMIDLQDTDSIFKFRDVIIWCFCLNLGLLYCSSLSVNGFQESKFWKEHNVYSQVPL